MSMEYEQDNKLLVEFIDRYVDDDVNELHTVMAEKPDLSEMEVVFQSDDGTVSIKGAARYNDAGEIEIHHEGEIYVVESYVDTSYDYSLIANKVRSTPKALAELGSIYHSVNPVEDSPLAKFYNMVFHDSNEH